MKFSLRRLKTDCVKWYRFNRNQNISNVVDRQFTNPLEARAIKHLIKIRVLPILDAPTGGSRKKSLEKAHADLRVVLNSDPPLKPQLSKSEIVQAEGLTTEELFEKCEPYLKLVKFLSGNTPKLAAAYAKAVKKSEQYGRHRVLCSEYEWEILNRLDEALDALKKKELKIFASKLKHKTNAKNLSLTLRRLGLSVRNQNKILF